MDIPNLSQNPAPLRQVQKKSKFIFVVIITGLIFGFVLSRIVPMNSSSATVSTNSEGEKIVSNITSSDEVKAGKVYGNAATQYKDSVTGVVQKGSINGEGTHILVRDGGDSQRVSLTSSAVDLDLFVDKKVEIKGETNASKKTGWLLDVGTIKVLE